MEMGYRYREPVIRRPQNDPDFAPKCPWPRETPIDYWTDRTWYPILCAPNGEKRASEWLIRYGFRPYWPHYTTHHRTRQGKQQVRKRSVIGGVVIIPMATGMERFEVVRSLPYVRDFMLLSGIPQALTEREVNCIRSVEAEKNMPIADLSLPDWCVVGAQVRIKIVGDEHWDLSGPVIEVAGPTRIVVTVPLLGCQRPMTVKASQIEPI